MWWNYINVKFLRINVVVVLFELKTALLHKPPHIYGAWMISRHIFNLQTGQNGFSKTPIQSVFQDFRPRYVEKMCLKILKKCVENK